MKVRYKKTGSEADSNHFNVAAVNEVLTGDDSAFISELDVWIVAIQAWKDMNQAFRDRDITIDNYNTVFFEPHNAEERERGYAL